MVYLIHKLIFCILVHKGKKEIKIKTNPKNLPPLTLHFNLLHTITSPSPPNPMTIIQLPYHFPNHSPYPFGSIHFSFIYLMSMV